jgi:hypothetical protein
VTTEPEFPLASPCSDIDHDLSDSQPNNASAKTPSVSVFKWRGRGRDISEKTCKEREEEEMKEAISAVPATPSSCPEQTQSILQLQYNLLSTQNNKREENNKERENLP